MPPIPIHIEDPITPVKAQGVTPQTQAQAPPAFALPATTTATTTTGGYPAARPGAAAVPAPTSAVPRPQPSATRTYNPPELSDPPPPQPGAVPVVSAALSAPPRPLPPPEQTSWAPPQGNYAPTRSTDITPATPQKPVTLNLGPVSSPAAHPPGYQQNAYAQELNSQQRATLDAQEARERNDVFAAPANTDVWESVKAIGSSVGEGAAKVHGEVWKWIDGKH